MPSPPIPNRCRVRDVTFPLDLWLELLVRHPGACGQDWPETFPLESGPQHIQNHSPGWERLSTHRLARVCLSIVAGLAADGLPKGRESCFCTSIICHHGQMQSRPQVRPRVKAALCYLRCPHPPSILQAQKFINLEFLLWLSSKKLY